MIRIDFEERAAILEYDGGISRADAEAQALRELCDQKGANLPGILGELVEADRRRRHPDLAPVLADLGLESVTGLTCGFGYVVADSETYRPAHEAETAHAAFIVPAVDDGSVADLVACTLASRRMRCRLGIAAVVGVDEVDRARETAAPLYVFNDVVRWLRGSTRGAVIIDWGRAAREIEGVQVLICSESLASRLHDATSRCWPRPTIAFASETIRHAA
jgi:hypothetical protein